MLGEIPAPAPGLFYSKSIPFPPVPLWKTLRCSSSVSVQHEYTDVCVCTHTHMHTCIHAYMHTPHLTGGAVRNISIMESAEGALPIERFQAGSASNSPQGPVLFPDSLVPIEQICELCWGAGERGQGPPLTRDPRTLQVKGG